MLYLIGNPGVSVLLMNAVELDPILRGFLISRLVLEVFKVMDTLYILEGIEISKVPVEIFS